MTAACATAGNVAMAVVIVGAIVLAVAFICWADVRTDPQRMQTELEKERIRQEAETERLKIQDRWIQP